METAHLSRILGAMFPDLDTQQQQLSISLYRLLAQGEPVSLEVLAQAARLSMEAIERLLPDWSGVHFNAQHEVTAYWGLSTEETPHRLRVNTRTVYTWCAWDALFIPALLKETVRVDSLCPVTGRAIELTVSSERAQAEGKSLWVSFLLPDTHETNRDVVSCFCHFVHFFDDAETAEHWRTNHPGTFLLPLDEAFEVGRRVNETRYARIAI